MLFSIVLCSNIDVFIVFVRIRLEVLDQGLNFLPSFYLAINDLFDKELCV